MSTHSQRQSSVQTTAQPQVQQQQSRMRTGPASRNTSGVEPANRTDDAGNATTGHFAPDFDGGLDAPMEFTDPEHTERMMEVELVHGPTDPLGVSGTPNESDLYDVLAEGPECTGAGQAVTGVFGSMDQPNLSQAALEDNIYIDNTPSMADVHQGGLSDCYFLASLVEVIQHDVGHIQDMVTLSGNQVSVDFFRYDASAGNWVPTTITVDHTVAREVNDSGEEGALVGAGWRVGQSPAQSKWHAGVDGETLEIHRLDEYEMATWAPMVEKAYARYIDRFGQYGGFDTASANTEGVGYDRINGGIAQYSYHIFYGDDATVGESAMNFAPGSDLVATNIPAIQNLLRLEGEGMNDGEEFMMTVMISPDDSVDRLGDQVEAILDSDESQRYRTLRSHLQRLKAAIENWDGKTTDDDRAAALRPITRRAANLATPGNWPLLHSDSAPKEYQDLNELCNVVMLLGSDSSAGQRHTYAWHSYSVIGSNFQDGDGNDIEITMANLAAQSANIDPNNSTVRLRNPHGTNEPNARGEGSLGDDDGFFNLTLDQFFRSFALQQHAVVRT